ncbi:hypothetical protein C8R44DRAFT_735937 [Mycena epipterygia]|nr:hypothetical protein C8R44DRAFT_735937 [Mycena epipterygia]
MTTATSVPTIDSATLPSPADDWAENTNSILGAHKVASTPPLTAPPVPGSFPDEAPPPQRSGETLMDSARAYLPAEDDVQRAMTNVGQTAKAYLPQGMAAYLPSASDADLPPPRPPFMTDDRANSNLSTEAQAGSLRPPLAESVSTITTMSVPQTPDGADSTLSTTVHTGTTDSLNPVPPLVRSKFTEEFVTPPGLNMTESPASLSSSSMAAFVPPSHSAGGPAPPNSTAPTADTALEAPTAGPDVVAPSPHGVLDPSAPVENVPEDDHTAHDDGVQRKPKLVQRLKEKMHVGHART